MKVKKVAVAMLAIILLWYPVFFLVGLIPGARALGLPFSVYGIVTDETGAIVADASVRVYGTLGFPFPVIYTDSP